MPLTSAHTQPQAAISGKHNPPLCAVQLDGRPDTRQESHSLPWALPSFHSHSFLLQATRHFLHTHTTSCSLVSSRFRTHDRNRIDLVISWFSHQNTLVDITRNLKVSRSKRDLMCSFGATNIYAFFSIHHRTSKSLN